jgi:hypothetical protein
VRRRIEAAGDQGGDGRTQSRVRGEGSVVPRLALAGRRDQGGQPAEEGDGRKDDLGLAGEPGPAQAVGDLAGGGPAQALVRERRARAVSEARSP